MYLSSAGMVLPGGILDTEVEVEEEASRAALRTSALDVGRAVGVG